MKKDDAGQELPDLEAVKMRFVTIKGVKYLRIEDVVNFIREMAGAEEETDVRNRFNEAASNLMKRRYE